MGTANVQTDYGAAGDGSTDDTAAIQSAIDDATGGDTVFLPDGTYLVSKPESVDNSACIYLGADRGVDGVTFKGNGSGTIIKLDGGHGDFTHVVDAEPTSTITGLEIRNFVIDYNRANQDSSTIRGHSFKSTGGSHQNEILVKNVEAKKATDSNFRTSGGTTLERCTSLSAGRNGISIHGDPAGNDCNVYHCLSKRSSEVTSPTYNLDFSEGKGIVEDTVLLDSNGSGFKTSENTSDVTFRRVRNEGNQTLGYQHTGSNPVTVTFEDIVTVNGGDVGFRFPNANATWKLPSGAAIIANDCNKRGFLADSGEVRFAGDTYAKNNPTSEWDTIDCTGFVDHGYFEGTWDDGGGSTTITTEGDTAKSDLSNVPTAAEVGAFSTSETDTTSASASIPTASGLIQSSSGTVDTL